MNFNKFINNWIVKNIVLAAIAVLALIFCINLGLGFITKHGKSIVVPDMTNMTVSEAKHAANSAGLTAEVYDSVFVRRMERGVVFSQNPSAGSNVKSDRRIFLTINAKNAKKVTMPDLVGCSLRQAQAEINSKGLYVGQLIYKTDMATDCVLEQQYKGRTIRKGTQIESGSYIDLVVGLNNGNLGEDMGLSSEIQTYIPNVIGMKFLRAMDAVHDNSLNVKLIFDKDIHTYSDSLDAVVYKQNPEASNVPIIKGENVSIYLKSEAE